jgi:hypothetical protein
MGFITWIVNRHKPQQQAVAEKALERAPHATEYFAQKAAQDLASLKPISSQLRAQVSAFQATIYGASLPAESALKLDASTEGGNPSAQVQKQDGQENTQASLSPTDGAKGRSPSQEKPAIEEKSSGPAKPQKPTIQRPTPSWER